MGRGGEGQGDKEYQAGYFKGDDDLMVDRLVFACAQQKKGLEVALPGFGRDLVPYFVPGDDEPSHSHINGELTVNPPTLQATPKKAKPVRTVTILKNGTLAVHEDGVRLKTEYAVTEDGVRLKKPSHDFESKAAAGVTDAQRRAAANAFAACKQTPTSSYSSSASQQQPQKQPRAKTVLLEVVSNHAAKAAKGAAPAAAVWASGAHTNSPAPLHIPMPSMLSSLGVGVASHRLSPPPTASSTSLPQQQTAQAAKPKPMLLTPAQLLALAMSSQPPRLETRRSLDTNHGGATLLAMLQPPAAPMASRFPPTPPHKLVDASASQALRELLNC